MTLATHAEPARSRPTVAFLARDRRDGRHDTRLRHCIQCGTCGGSCPSAADMDHTPRELFAMIRAGMRDEVLAQQHAVDVRLLLLLRRPLPAGDPHPGRDVRAQGDRRPRGPARPSRPRRTSRGPSSSTSRRFGRSYEIGLVARHYLRHFPLRLPGHGADGRRDARHAAGWASCPHRIQRRDGPARDPRPGRRSWRRRSMSSATSTTRAARWSGTRRGLRASRSTRSAGRSASTSTRSTTGTAAARASTSRISPLQRLRPDRPQPRPRRAPARTARSTLVAPCSAVLRQPGQDRPLHARRPGARGQRERRPRRRRPALHAGRGQGPPPARGHRPRRRPRRGRERT